MVSFCVTIRKEDMEMLVFKFFERMDICRQCGCVNACWKMTSDNTLRIRPIDGADTTIVFKQSATGQTEIRSFNTRRQCDEDFPIDNPCEDPIQMEELYLFWHHLNFGLCTIKRQNSSAPLQRIDALEMHYETLKDAVMGDYERKRKEPDSATAELSAKRALDADRDFLLNDKSHLT